MQDRGAGRPRLRFLSRDREAFRAGGRRPARRRRLARRIAIGRFRRRRAAVAQALDQARRFRIGLRTEFTSQRLDEILRVGIGRVPAAMAGKETYQQPLRGLAQRIERDQPFGRVDGLRTVPGPILARRALLEDKGRRRRHPAALVAQPGVERFGADRQPVEKRPAVQLGGARQVGQFIRMRQCQERAHIHRDGGVVERDRFASDDQRRSPYRLKFLAQRQQALAQALARLPVGTVPPQERCQPLARFREFRPAREIGQQGAMTRRRHREHARRRTIDAGGKTAKKL